jgi:hypothetical protein
VFIINCVNFWVHLQRLEVWHFKPLKMDLTEGSETSANINQTLGKHPKVDTINTEHSESLKSRINKACYAIRAVKSFMSLRALKTVYFSYFHSIMSYGVIFWGNSCVSNDIFRIQKRIIRILNNKSKHDSCRHLFKQLQILTLPSQYIYSLLIFVVKNRDLFSFNLEIHNLNTWYKNNLHFPLTNLTMVQKRVLYSGSRVFNYLPLQIKSLSGDLKSFKRKLKNFLLDHTFYSLDEFYQLTS